MKAVIDANEISHAVPAGGALWTLRSIPERNAIDILDQTLLPAVQRHVRLQSAEDAARAIRTMQVRGAPLIGATAAFGLALALQADASPHNEAQACELLLEARPTAVNLRWALERVRAAIAAVAPGQRANAAWEEAEEIAREDVAVNRSIAGHGLALIERLAARSNRSVQVLTHCNAGALATLGWGTATAPIYLAHERGIPLHVWVSETRPRLQGARLTAFELMAHGVPSTLIVDSAGALLMRRGNVDIVIVGADRVARNGDVCNKIGTYEKALAARDNGIPFYVALPSSTIDWRTDEGDAIAIEERGAEEVLLGDGATLFAPAHVKVANPAFDITPARLVTGFITEAGVCSASEAGLVELFPTGAR